MCGEIQKQDSTSISVCLEGAQAIASIRMETKYLAV